MVNIAIPAPARAIPRSTRYFDHTQHRPSVRKAAETLAPAFALVPIDLEIASKIERKADPSKEKKKKEESEALPPPAE